MKIALIGTDVTSQGAIPWEDPSWKIWACSAAQLTYPRIDEHFELHNIDFGIERNGEKEVEYLLGLSQRPVVWIIKPHELLPKAKILPRQTLVDQFGPYFWTSSIAWMMAKAIHDGAEEIGLFGITMSHASEYAFQRPGCYYFMQMAANLGISIFAPPESDILIPPPQYGYREYEPIYRKMFAAKEQAKLMLKETIEQETLLMCKEHGIRGALERINYDIETFSIPELGPPVTRLQVVDTTGGSVESLHRPLKGNTP